MRTACCCFSAVARTSSRFATLAQTISSTNPAAAISSFSPRPYPCATVLTPVFAEESSVRLSTDLRPFRGCQRVAAAKPLLQFDVQLRRDLLQRRIRSDPPDNIEPVGIGMVGVRRFSPVNFSS